MANRTPPIPDLDAHSTLVSDAKDRRPIMEAGWRKFIVDLVAAINVLQRSAASVSAELSASSRSSAIVEIGRATVNLGVIGTTTIFKATRKVRIGYVEVWHLYGGGTLSTTPLVRIDAALGGAGTVTYFGPEQLIGIGIVNRGQIFNPSNSTVFALEAGNELQMVVQTAANPGVTARVITYGAPYT
jgi:hypothetical protein